MVGSYSEGYTHGVRSAITADTPTSAANKIHTSAVRINNLKVAITGIRNQYSPHSVHISKLLM